MLGLQAAITESILMRFGFGNVQGVDMKKEGRLGIRISRRWLALCVFKRLAIRLMEVGRPHRGKAD